MAESPQNLANIEDVNAKKDWSWMNVDFGAQSELSYEMTYDDIVGLDQEEHVGRGEVCDALARLSEVFHQRVNNEAIQYGYHVQNLLTGGGNISFTTDYQGDAAVQQVSSDTRMTATGGHGDCACGNHTVGNDFGSKTTLKFIEEQQKLKCLLKSFVLASSISRNLMRRLTLTARN